MLWGRGLDVVNKENPCTVLLEEVKFSYRNEHQRYQLTMILMFGNIIVMLKREVWFHKQVVQSTLQWVKHRKKSIKLFSLLFLIKYCFVVVRSLLESTGYIYRTSFMTSVWPQQIALLWWYKKYAIIILGICTSFNYINVVDKKHIRLSKRKESK